MNPFRVLLVSPIGEVGGGEKVFLTLARNLSSRGIEPIIACMRPGPLVALAEKQNIRVFEFKPHRYRNLSTVYQGVRWLIKLIKETNVQLIHTNYAGHIYSSLAAKIAGVPEVWHIHDYPYEWDWVDQLSLRLPTNFVIFTTEKVKSGYPALAASPHAVIPPSCIDPIALRSGKYQADIREKYALPPGSLLLTVARLQEHKGHRYLLEAIPEVLRFFPEVIFAIVGKSSGYEQELYTRELLDRTRDLGMEKSVKFIGYVGEEDLVSLYREASALIHPAITEGFGLVLLEAMAFGVPVIAAAADGPRELITNGKNGLLVTPGDSSSLARAIVSFLKNPELAKELSENSANSIDRFTIEKMIDSIINIYRDLISHSFRE